MDSAHAQANTTEKRFKDIQGLPCRGLRHRAEARRIPAFPPIAPELNLARTSDWGRHDRLAVASAQLHGVAGAPALALAGLRTGERGIRGQQALGDRLGEVAEPRRLVH